MSTYIEYEPDTKHAGKNPETSDSPDPFTDCGRKIEADELVVDIDHLGKDAIKALIDTFQIETEVVWTDRGAHLWFRKPANRTRFSKDGVCKLGIKIELKHASNSPKGITIKRHGTMRTIENEGLRDEFPDILAFGKYHDLTGMSDGEGRNTALFRHKVAIRKSDDWYRILQFINAHVFAEPLPDKEFNALVQSEMTGKTVSDSTEEYETAMTIMKERKCVKWAGSIWYLNDSDEYDCNQDKFNRVMRKYAPGKPTRFIDEIGKQIMYGCEMRDEYSRFKIRLENGFLQNGRFYPMKSDEFTPYAIDISYDKDAEPVQVVDDYLSQLSGAEGYAEEDRKAYRDLILETMAYGLITDLEKTRALCRFFIYRGDGGNGKGTLLEIIRRLLGDKNCSAMSIEQIGDPAYIPSLIGKLVNLGDDIEAKPITTKQFKNIKNITSGDSVEVRKLYKQSETTRLPVKLIFTSNSDIRTFDKGDALKRRICWMPMFTRVEHPDHLFISKITTPEALQYWMRLVVEAYERLYTKGWTKSVISDDYNTEYHKHNDLMEMFILDTEFEELHYKTIGEIKKLFAEWNTDDDNRGFNGNNFKDALWRIRKAGFIKGKAPGQKEVRTLIKLQAECSKSIKPTFK